MKTSPTNRKGSRGSVLVASLTITAIAALALASYLTLVKGQTASVSRSQMHNMAMAVTEAGVEEGMAMINSAAATNAANPWVFTNYVAASGWSAWTNNACSITRTVSGSNSYMVTISVNSTSGTPMIDSIGNIPNSNIPWAFGSLPHPFVAAAGLNTDSGNVARRVQVMTKSSGATNTGGVSLFNYGLLAKDRITFSGNTICDSYDSSNPLYSTNGQYTASKRKAGCGVATDDTVANSVTSSGTLNIYGSLYTGVGGFYSFSGNVSIGDATWVPGKSGIQTGHFRNDMNVAIPNVTAPAGSGIPPASGTVGTTKYYYVLSTSDSLYTSTAAPVLSGNNSILVSGTNVTWWLQKGMTVSGNFSLIIAPGASLKLYLGNTSGSSVSFTMSGSGVVNDSLPSSCQIYGLPTLTSFTYSGSHSFNGTLYAPQAAYTMSGNSDYYGAAVAKSITKSGSFNFHYDESLKSGGGGTIPSAGWVVSSWKELPVQ